MLVNVVCVGRGGYARSKTERYACFTSGGSAISMRGAPEAVTFPGLGVEVLKIRDPLPPVRDVEGSSSHGKNGTFSTDVASYLVRHMAAM